MAEILVNLVFGKLCDAVLQEIFSLCGVNEKVEQVKRELNRIRCFLRDADCKSAKNERVKHWVNELRDVSYWIEDTIDLFVLELDEQSGTVPGVQKLSLKAKFKNMLKKPKKLVITHKFGEEIDKILSRIDEIAKSRETYGIENLGESSELGPPVPFKRHIIPDLNDKELVGVEDQKEQIVAQLLDGKCLRRLVVSIVGPGGLGKTTVAVKAYSSDAVKNQFDVRIWLSISQNFRPIDILKEMLKGIRPLGDNEKDEGEMYFMIEVNKSLKDKKYLIALDDVWSEDLWSQIEPILPDVKNGSRVLITSRFLKIPKAADPASTPHELRFLNEEESLELLLKTALSNRDDEKDCRTNLSYIAKQLAKKCDGLPLALLVLGGRLSVNEPIHSVWEKVLNTMVWSVYGKKCMDILATSYDDMPITLKICFMYLACFPEDYRIKDEDLIRLRVAEGFVPQIADQTMEDVAEDYLEELAQRSMIEVLKRSLHDNSILTCRIHDLLRDLAIEKAKEINFLTVCANGDVEQDFGKARRVAVHNFDSNELMKRANSNLRTLMCFYSCLPDCSGHKLIKVLYFPTISRGIKHDVKRIEGLSQLRYLNLNDGASVPNQEYWDKLIGSMKNLQTFQLSYLHSPVRTPDCIWHIKTLRHVQLPVDKHAFLLGHPQLIVLQNLHTLPLINCKSVVPTNFPNLPNLRRLEIRVKDFPWTTVIAFLHSLKKLVDLKISADDIPIEVFDMESYPFYHHLTSLSYYCDTFSNHGRRTTFQTTMFPLHLSMLTLAQCELHQDHISVLEKLPVLKELQLREAAVDENMRFSTGGFPHLKILEFRRLKNLVNWEVEKGAMPMLIKLTVLFCENMEVPVGTQYLTTLRNVNWDSTFMYRRNMFSKMFSNMCPSVELDRNMSAFCDA